MTPVNSQLDSKIENSALGASGGPLDTSEGFQNCLKGLRTLKGYPKFYQGLSQIT